ncbi:MAG: MOSC domain-containing protein [Microbacteriaceae bacterium]|nr:MOSC domain-containing protein [Microbacteriaceae bacterium]
MTHLLGIRRFPVKAMAGEPLDRAEVDARGLVGDRAWAVVDADGKLATGKHGRRFRRFDAIFDFGAATGADGVVRVVRHRGGDGDAVPREAGDPGLDAELASALEAPVRLLPEDGVAAPGDWFDSGAVSLVGSATAAWAERELGAGAAVRRLRANLVVETAEPFEEETWLGRRLRIGEAELIVEQRIARCRMVDLAQDGVPAPAPLLKALGATRDAKLAVYCRPTRAGALAVGNAVALV